MGAAVRGGVVLGLLVSLWTLFMLATGWYKDPLFLFAFWLVVPMQIAVLIWTLGRTSDRYGFATQLGLGLLVSAIGGTVIFFSSILFTGVAFPHYFREMHALQERILRGSGKSEAEVQRMLAVMSQDATPLGQAVSGLAGTMVTGLLASLGVAAYAHRRRPAPPRRQGVDKLS
jgi:hypothetical protein